MRERLKPTMVRLSLPIKLKHLQYTLHRQACMKCACRQLLQCYTKSAMQVCFVFFDPASLIQANFALRRWYDTPAMLHLSAIPSRSPNCLATSVYGGGRGESTSTCCSNEGRYRLSAPRTFFLGAPACFSSAVPCPPRPVALRRRSPGIRVCARFLAVVGIDASVANTPCLVVALRVRQTAHSMKIGSADTAFVVRKQRRARRVVRLRYAERTRCARHRAAGSIAESCVSR